MNIICKLFGHRYGQPQRVSDGAEMEWIEESCVRKRCPAYRTGQLGNLKVVNPDNFLSGKDILIND